MIIGGLQKVSLIDYPSKVSAVIFTQGCNYRCPYCHNPELVDPELYNDPIDAGSVLNFLSDRKGKLDGVVLTGGEPTLQEDLIPFLERIRRMDYLIKLDTNGSSPDVIKEVIKKGLADYIAMDVKAPLEKYYLAAGVRNAEDSVRESIDIIIDSGVEHEFRTTVDESLLSKDDISRIAEMVHGCKKYRLQDMVADRRLLGKDS